MPCWRSCGTLSTPLPMPVDVSPSTQSSAYRALTTACGKTYCYPGIESWRGSTPPSPTAPTGPATEPSSSCMRASRGRQGRTGGEWCSRWAFTSGLSCYSLGVPVSSLRPAWFVCCWVCHGVARQVWQELAHSVGAAYATRCVRCRCCCCYYPGCSRWGAATRMRRPE